MRMYFTDDAVYRRIDNLMTEVKSYLDHRAGAPVNPDEIARALRSVYRCDYFLTLDHPDVPAEYRTPSYDQRYPVGDSTFREVDAIMAEIKSQLNSVTGTLIDPDEVIMALTTLTDRLYLWHHHNNPLCFLDDDPVDRTRWRDAAELGYMRGPDEPEFSDSSVDEVRSP